MWIDPRFKPLGDTALVIELGDAISLSLHHRIRSLCWLLEQEPLRGVIEWVPAYTTVTVYYHPSVIRYGMLVDALRERLKQVGQVELPPPELVVLPTLYGGAEGPDLEVVAAYHSMTEGDVVEIHTQKSYLVYMMGFTPGFAYLGGMSERIATPRRSEPRTRIPAGSVGIAGGQTGVYPLETPGGWQLIGRTPVRLYDAHQQPPILLRAGYYVQFRSIQREEYEDIEEQVRHHRYAVEHKAYSEGEVSGDDAGC